MATTNKEEHSEDNEQKNEVAPPGGFPNNCPKLLKQPLQVPHISSRPYMYTAKSLISTSMRRQKRYFMYEISLPLTLKDGGQSV